MFELRPWIWILCGWLVLGFSVPAAPVFRIATYNVENYVEKPSLGRQPKSPASKAKIVESIGAMSPDILALQEIGSRAILEELRNTLRTAGMDFPYDELVHGADPNIRVAVLSRYPIVARRSHTNESFLLRGRRFRVNRGFAEVDIKVADAYTITLMAAHLKSRRASAEADEAELRLEEAKLLRNKIDIRLSDDPNANLVVLGDFNDTRDSAAVRTLLGRGKSRLVDTRPSEKSKGSSSFPENDDETRTVTWTHHYLKEDTYGRVDYILLSAGMAREWEKQGTYVLAFPGWGQASDHRPLVATFEAEDK